MHKLYIYMYTLVLLFISTTITAQDKKSKKLDIIADEVCECASEMINLQDKLLSLQKEKKYDEIKKLISEVENQSVNFEKCINTLTRKYPEMETNETYQKQLEEKLKIRCPKILLSDNGVQQNKIENIADEQINNNDVPYTAFASDVCDCVNDEPQLMQEFNEIKSRGDKTALNEYRRTFYHKYPNLLICLATVNEKYPNLRTLNQHQKNKLTAVEEECPSYLELLKLE